MLAVLAASLFVWSPWSMYPFGVAKTAASGVCCLVLCLSFGFGGVRRSRMWLPVLLFAAVALLSWVFSVDREMGLVGEFGQPFFGLAILAQCLVVFASEVSFTRLCDFTVMCLYAEAWICVLGLAGVPSWALVGAAGRAVGTIGSPVFLGSWVAVAAPLAWGSRYRAVGVAAALFLLWVTGSRGAAVAICAAALAVYRPRYLWVLVLLLPLVFTKRKAHSDSLRRITWTVAARAGAEHPVLGWGPDTLSIAYREVKRASDLRPNDQANTVNQSAHNDVLQVWATLGGLGLAAYAFFLFRLGRELPAMNPVLVASLLSLFIQAKVNPLANAALLWGAAVLACAG